MAHAEEPNLVIARHVLLWEGREIVTVQEAEKRIAALASKGEVSPRFFLTSGSIEAAGIGSFHTQISQSETRMLCKTVVYSNPTEAASKRYDAIRTEADLVPDPALRIQAGLKCPDGQPAQNAEVVLCLLEEATYSLYIEGEIPRLRNRINDVVTLSGPDGSFTHYPPRGSKWLLAVLHESGFAAVRAEEFQAGQIMELRPWANVTVHFMGKQSENYPLKASVSNRPLAAHGLPLPLWLDYSNQSPDDANQVNFRVAPGETAISRIVETSGDNSFYTFSNLVTKMPVATGESKRVEFGPVTGAEVATLESQRAKTLQRMKKLPAP